MKLLLIPDVHGRDFWIEPCKHIDEFDKVIFLGDYHDPYTFQVSPDTSRHRLKEQLVPFVEEHKDKVVCLRGNHDYSYLTEPFADRFDYYHKDEIKALLERMNPILGCQIDGYLFTHSGVLPAWLEANNLTLDDVLNDNVPLKALMQVSPRRGGWDKCGSCVWGDVGEYHQSVKIPELYQIFGHTQLENEIITNEWACLDARKAFTLDTETKELTAFEA